MIIPQFQFETKMNYELERRINEQRDRLLNILASLRDEICQLEFQNAELLMRDRQREIIIKDQDEELKRLKEELRQLKNYISIFHKVCP